MKKIIHLKIVLCLGLFILSMLLSSPSYVQELTPTIIRSGQNASQTHSIYSSNNTSKTTYFIPRYVMGSGGVMHAVSTNHFLNATTGEMFVGGMESSNNFLLS